MTLAAVIVLVLLNSVAFGLSASNVAVYKTTEGYYMVDTYLDFSVKITGSNNNPATVKANCPRFTNGGQTQLLISTLTRNRTMQDHSSRVKVTQQMYAPGRKTVWNGYTVWSAPQVEYRATANGTTVKVGGGGYITVGNKAAYTSIDSTFAYSSATNNSFRSVGTPVYNCLTYVISMQDTWDCTFWSWYWYNNNVIPRNPTAQELDDFMAKRGSHANRYGRRLQQTDNPWNCDVIYYSDYEMGIGNDGYFAKVVAWDNQGNPTAVMSKWGSWELIYSSSPTPFKTSGAYGLARRYYKYI